MSRLGKMPIPLPKGVEIKATKEGLLHIKGPKGALELQLPSGLHFKPEGQVVVLERLDEKVVDNAVYGLYRSLLKNHIVGVSTGYEVRLAMIGVGYRAAVQGSQLELQVGFSRPVRIEIPKVVQVAVDKGTAILITGSDKREVGQFAATVRAVKPPEPYKGKGIRYEERMGGGSEYVRKKEGKAAKAKTA